MATVSSDVTEWLDVAGTPLDTPAWETIDLGVIYGMAGLRGSGVPLAQRVGEDPRARIPAGKPIDVPLRIFGVEDSDGNAWADPVEGLRRNTEELKQALRPRLNASGGTATGTHHLSDGSTRESPVQLTGQLATSAREDAVALRAVAALWLPEGMWKSTTATSNSASAFPMSIGNAGTADQFDLTITLSGDATSVTLSNSDWGASTDLTVAVNLANGDVTVDTGAMTATQGGSSVVGSVSHNTDGAFPARWLPLVAGQANSIGVSHDGTTLTVTIDHYPRWL